MLFWPLIITGSLLFAAFMAATPGQDGAPLSADEARRVFATVMALSMTIAAAMRLLLRQGPSGSGFAAGAMGATLVGVALMAPSTQEEIRRGWDRVQGSFVPSLALSVQPGQVELRRAWDGHYRADTHVNGVPMRMMVDTGASMVVLPYERAAEVGVDLARLDFSMPVATANGPSTVAPVRLATVAVGVIEVDDVEAAIARPGRVDVPLLGMSFLERLSETSFRGDRLILTMGPEQRRAGTYFVPPPTPAPR